MTIFGQLHITHGAVSVPGHASVELPPSADAVADHARLDDLGRYRPLSGARTLPTGWSTTISPAFSAEDAIEAVYPLAIVHQRQLGEGSLRVVPLDDVLQRQSGRYESTSALSSQGRGRAVETVCAACVRKPVWNGAACSPGEIPCPEACSVFVAFCREAAIWEESPPAPTAPDSTVPWAAFEEPGNELREQFLEGWRPR